MERGRGAALGVHGMLVFGGQRTEDAFRSPVYASHLPMFMAPHDFQVILKVSGKAAGRYGDFVAHFGASEIYTFEPERFSIDELQPEARAMRRGAHSAERCSAGTSSEVAARLPPTSPSRS